MSPQYPEKLTPTGAPAADVDAGRSGGSAILGCTSWFRLYAALSAYLLAGIFFGHFYWVLQQIRPGTFAVTGDFSRMSAIYFSFVTLATLGYGDIVPRTDVARGLVVVEGVGGQLFLAVLIARLVSLYARGRAAN